MLDYLSQITESLDKIQFFLRHYVYIILQTFYKYLVEEKDNKNYPEINSNIKMYFYILINFLKIKNVVPNEEMMRLFIL